MPLDVTVHDILTSLEQAISLAEAANLVAFALADANASGKRLPADIVERYVAGTHEASVAVSRLRNRAVRYRAQFRTH